MKKIFDLQMFAEEAAAETSSSASATVEGSQEPVQDDVAQTSGDSSNVQVAAEQQEPNFAEQISAMSDEDKISLYDNLIKNDTALKKHYNSSFKAALNGRMSKVEKKAQEEIGKYEGFVQNLSNVYGTDDLTELQNKLLFNDDLIEAQAYKEGISAEQLKRQRQLEMRENRLTRAEEARREEEANEAQLREWQNAAEAVKADYPDFDFDDEFTNDETGEQFYNLIAAGTPMKTAYEIVHINDIMDKRVSEAVKLSQKETVDTIRARGTRPAENAAGSQAPSAQSIDVDNLTSEQIRDIVKRVSRGEVISF